MRHDMVKTFYFAEQQSKKDDYEIVAKYVPPLITANAVKMPISDYISITRYGQNIDKIRRLYDDVGELSVLNKNAVYGVWSNIPEPVMDDDGNPIEYLSPEYILETPVVQIENMRRCDIRMVEVKNV